MEGMRLRETGGWLIAGCVAVAAGGALAVFWWLEFGAALVVLGAAALGYGGGVARSAAVDAALTARVDRQIEELRTAQRRAAEADAADGGLSPTGDVWRALRRGAGPDPDPALADDTERRLAALIRKRCDSVWEGIGARRYWRQEDGRTVGPDFATIGKDIESVVREVAELYHRDTADPVMAARMGDLVLAGRSVLGELLQIARLAPVVDLPGWSLETTRTRLEQAQQLHHLYRTIAPYTTYANFAAMAGRFAFGANPVGLAAWYLGGRAATEAGMYVAERYFKAWLRDALEEAIALVYLYVARTYNPRLAQYTADYAALSAALDIHRRVAGVDHNRRLLLDRILRARIPDEFAKLTLLRALADDAAPDAAEMPAVDFATLSPARRHAIAQRLTDILPAMRGLDEPEASHTVEELERRLGRGLQVDLVRAGSRAAVRIEEGFLQLAVLACDWCRFDRARARSEIAGSRFAYAAQQRLSPREIRRLLGKGLDSAFDGRAAAGLPADPAGVRPIEPPRDLVGEDLASPLVEALIDLLAQAASDEWPIEHDHIVLLNASVLLGARKAAEAAWKRYLKAVSTRLRARLQYPDASSWPEAAAPAILRRSALPQAAPAAGGGVTARPAPPPLAVFEAAGGSASWWVLLLHDRVLVGRAPEETVALDDAEPDVWAREDVRFLRRPGRLADDLVIRCGDRRLTVAGRPLLETFTGRFGALLATFTGRFGPLLERLGLDAAALDTAEDA